MTSSIVRYVAFFSINLSVAVAQPPVIDRLLPAAGSPGDFLVVEGQNLSGVTALRFRLQDSGPGFALSYLGDVPVVPVSGGRLGVVVPTIGSTQPPSNLPSGVDPVGSVRLVTPATTSVPVSFLFQQATRGRIGSLGAGSTQTSGVGRAVTTFDTGVGIPFSLGTLTLGSPGVQGAFRVVNATPGGSATLVAGTPATNPSITVQDGLIALDLGAPLVSFAPATVDATGVAPTDLVFPGFPPFGLNLAFQYVLVDPADGSLAIAQGLKLSF